MRRRNLYIIIGEGKCGKSSLVRALTGVFRRARRATRIRREDGSDISVNVWPQSAQEAHLSPQAILNRVNTAAADNVLLVLRFQPAPHMLQFDATAYIEVLSQNHDIVEVVFMGPGRDVQSITVPGNTYTLRRSLTNPVNENANQVRQEWHWV